MEDPTTKPSGSNPASPSSTYSDTDKSEVKTPDGSAPAVCASLLSAACGSQAAASPAGLLANSGMWLSSGQIHGVPAMAPEAYLRARQMPGADMTPWGLPRATSESADPHPASLPPPP